MTLIVAIPAQDGIIFGSDSQVTDGAVKCVARKIFPLNDHALWAASGELALIQRVAERIETCPNKEQSLIVIRDVLAQFVKDAVQSLLNVDFRTQFFLQNPAALLSLHPGDFLFVEYSEKARILHISANGTPEWIIDGRVKATGSGDLFAHALLQKYAGASLNCERAKLLAYKVIEEAIEVGGYGLGPPIDLWEVKSTGVKQVSEQEIAALEDAAHLLRGREVEMLTTRVTSEPPIMEQISREASPKAAAKANPEPSAPHR